MLFLWILSMNIQWTEFVTKLNHSIFVEYVFPGVFVKAQSTSNWQRYPPRAFPPLSSVEASADSNPSMHSSVWVEWWLQMMSPTVLFCFFPLLLGASSLSSWFSVSPFLCKSIHRMLTEPSTNPVTVPVCPVVPTPVPSIIEGSEQHSIKEDSASNPSSKTKRRGKK